MAEAPLIKCDCETCDCPSATPDGVCYECERGFHVTHWHDGEVKRAYDKASRDRPEYCRRCGEAFRAGEPAFADSPDDELVHGRCREKERPAILEGNGGPS